MKASETTIKDFIGGINKSFKIPPFQRNYTWSDVQCRELFEDIIATIPGCRKHYLGNVIYFQGSQSGASFTEIVLIDGQQRVTSILILLCALRDLCKDEDIRWSIENAYLFNQRKDEDLRIRLKQTEYDNENFSKLLRGEEGLDSTSAVAENYELFKELISASDVDYADLFEAIARLEIVDINLQVQDDLRLVQTVFEKINSTGTPLTHGDLIRNLLLLANSAEEQERLYRSYWVQIERNISANAMPRFARDYLTLKTVKDIKLPETYRWFKLFLGDVGTDSKNEVVLSEMLRYSKKYKWLVDATCQDGTIEQYISMLKSIDSNDLFPVLMHLIDKLYEDNKTELRKILNLLLNFMIRFRIVKPYGGGGDLRAVVLDLLDGLLSGDTECTHDAILFELSNSRSRAGRYPTDTEFKNSLMDSVNPKNARIVLARLESSETKNIPIEISQITIEHIMPQKLSDEWIVSLGGLENAGAVHSRFLNTIGNLTIVSGGYNSSMRNSLFEVKVDCYKESQFAITSEIAHKYTAWDEDALESRNESIAERCLQAIPGPSERVRPVTQQGGNPYTPGVYPIEDVDSRLGGSQMISLQFMGVDYPCTNFNKILPIIAEQVNDLDKDKFRYMVEENLIHKSTSTRNPKGKDPIFAKNADLFVHPVRVEGTDYFCEGALSNGRARHYARQLCEYFDIADSVSIEVA